MHIVHTHANKDKTFHAFMIVFFFERVKVRISFGNAIYFFKKIELLPSIAYLCATII